MARGLVTLAIRHGDVVQVDAEPVYEGDDFDYDLGLAPRLSHRPTLDPDDDAEIVAAYAIATFSDGRKKFKVVHRKDLAKARALSKSPAWTQWQGEMSCKVAIKRLLKTCNLTPEVADAIEADNSTESGGAAALPIDEPRKTRTQSAKERLREQAPPKDSGEASVDAVRNEMLRTGLMKEREPDRTAEGEPLPAEEPNQKGLPL
jgi:recombinational DNA repair protein RecT